MTQEPTIASIELIEDSLLEISYGDLMELRESFSEVTLFGGKIRSNYEKIRIGHAADLFN